MNSNLLEKYLLLKSALLEAQMVNSVHFAINEEMADELVINSQGRIVVISATTAQVRSQNDQIVFDLFIADKVNGDENEEYILQSWTNSLALLRHIADIMNYADNQNVVFSEVSLNVANKFDMARENVVATAYTQIEMSIESVPNIFIERVS